MASEDFVYDLITGKWHGAFLDEYEPDQTHGGQRPKIRPVRKAVPKLRGDLFPHPLDIETNIKQIPVVNGPDLRILVPSKNIPGLDYQSTPWAKLQADERQTIEKLREQLETVEKEKGKLKKENRRLREEQEEREKREASQSADKVACKYCGAKQTPQKWTSNDGRCESCGETMDKYTSNNRQNRNGGSRKGGK
ncbi:hypothetical protein [Natrinema salinisoli]|uniref:hypothetical protein n=1 Tax=Natrinema salinisoli TaxID=2878535 RepID=UPI001CF06D71|nr:hypothetical protein [Natrinema salinisoli]